MGNTTSSSDSAAAAPPPKHRREWPLAAILTARFTLVAAIPVLAFAFALMFHVIPSVRQDLDANHQAIASAVVAQVESYFSVADREMRTLAILLADDTQSTDQTTALLDAYVHANPFYESIYLADHTGHVSAIGLPLEMRSRRSNHIGLDVSQREFVREARQRKLPVWSNSFLSPVSLRVTIAIAVPVGNRVLIGEVAVTPLPALAKRITADLSITIMMLDRQNQLTAHSANAYANQQLNLGHLPIVAAARTGKKGVQTEFELNGSTVVGSAWPIADLDWLVLVTQTRELAYSQIYATWTRLFGVVLAAIVAALAAATWTSSAISRRFRLYSRQSQAIADGRYDLPWEASNTREFNQLRDNLQRMAVAIRSREDAMTTARAELQRSEQRLLATIEQTPNVAVQWYDGDGRIMMWNKASEIVYGIRAETAIGKTLDELIYTPAQCAEFRQMLAESSRTGPVGPYESSFTRPDGSQGYLLCTTFAIPGDAGSPRYVCMDIDITNQKLAERSLLDLNATLEERVEERTDELTRANDELVETLETLQRAQQELLRSEKLAALGSMVAGIAHELNTPIGNGLMASSTLDEHNRNFQIEVAAGNLRRSSLERYVADSQTATDILLRNLQRASDLIRSFKQVAVDQTSAQRRTFRLDQAIDEILLALQPTLKKQPLTLTREIDNEIWLDSYPGPLGQIITNLITNSINHGFEGRETGTIVISAQRISDDQIQLRICDDGKGIAPEHLNRVFDPFFTTRLGQGGSGLGMNIVHTLATQVLGGQIRIDSTLGAGTCVTLDLPQRAPESRSEESVAF